MKMKVILTKDVKSQGKKGEVIEVSEGYYKNFLLKQKAAVAYTHRSGEILDRQNAEKAEIERIKLEKAEALKIELEKVELKFTLKSNHGKTFGSVSSKQIILELKKQGFKIDKHMLTDKVHIATLGHDKVNLKLHKKVIVSIPVHVAEG